MTPEEATLREAIINKEIDISVSKIEIENLEKDKGLVAKRNLLSEQNREREGLITTLSNLAPQ